MCKTPRLRRVWARAVLAVARLLAAADGIVLAARSGAGARVASRERLVERLHSENELLRARLLEMRPAHRPRYTPWQPLRILWHQVRYGLSLRLTSQTFAVEPSTLARWSKAVERGGKTLVRSLQPVNRLPDLVRELTAALRFEQPRWGTRRIAQGFARLGVQVSRSSVQRILKRRPRRPARREVVGAGRRAGVRPRRPHQVWFVDFTVVSLFFGFLEIQVGAVLDGFSRSIVAIGLCRGRPSAAWACRLLRSAMSLANARPRHVISDRGVQFTSKGFRALLARQAIRRRYGVVGAHTNVAPIERFRRTLKSEWAAPTVLVWLAPKLAERSLLAWATWYQHHRPHQGIGSRTPEDVLQRRPRRPPLRLGSHMRLTLAREHLAGHATLPVYRLRKAA